MLALVSGSTRLVLPQVEPLAISAHRLAQKTKVLISEIKKLESKDIKKQLQVNDAAAKKMIADIGALENKAPVPCSLLFQNSFYECLDVPSMDQDECDYAQKHVRIFSGLFGMLRPFDAISSVAPPFLLSNKIVTPKGKTLRDYWEEDIKKQLKEDIRSIPGPPYTCLTMATAEDMEVLYREKPEGITFLTVEFQGMAEDDAWASKGEFLRWFIATQPYEVSDLCEFTGGDSADDEDVGPRFKLDVAASEGNKIVFEPMSRKGDWGKKLAASGMGATKFAKTTASGKQNKWERAEILKELSGKNQTQQRKQDRSKARKVNH